MYIRRDSTVPLPEVYPSHFPIVGGLSGHMVSLRAHWVVVLVPPPTSRKRVRWRKNAFQSPSLNMVSGTELAEAIQLGRDT